MQPRFVLIGPWIDTEGRELLEPAFVHIIRKLQDLQGSHPDFIPNSIQRGDKLQHSDHPCQCREVQSEQAIAHQCDIPRGYLGRGGIRT